MVVDRGGPLMRSWGDKLERMAAQHGVSIDRFDRSVTMWAPPGFRFVISQGHGCSAVYEPGFGETPDVMWESLRDDLSMGLETCTCNQCEGNRRETNDN